VGVPDDDVAAGSIALGFVGLRIASVAAAPGFGPGVLGVGVAGDCA
jgi:hypothetical protein